MRNMWRTLFLVGIPYCFYVFLMRLVVGGFGDCWEERGVECRILPSVHSLYPHVIPKVFLRTCVYFFS